MEINNTQGFILDKNIIDIKSSIAENGKTFEEFNQPPHE